MGVFYGGVEGGASQTTVVILDEHGHERGRSETSGSNPWVNGIEATGKLLLDSLHECKQRAGIPLDQPLEALGFSMSGMQQEVNQRQMRSYLNDRDPHAAKTMSFYNDSVGSMYTASDSGGMVIISGTGSMAEVVDDQGESHKCGGWGHMIGDEGGAYYIASKLIRATFRARDQNTGRKPDRPLMDYTTAEKLILEHFEISSLGEILTYMHRDFDKARIASLTIKIAEAAKNGDELCQSVLNAAGEHLGAMARTLAPHLSKTGSVWRSLDLFWDAFIRSAISTAYGNGGNDRSFSWNISSLKLLRLKDTGAIGATWKAAADSGCGRLSIDKSLYVEELKSYDSETG